ncbi:MAG: hypothetical protein ACREQC_00330, partial [Candidatus Binataceae bacterium]
ALDHFALSLQWLGSYLALRMERPFGLSFGQPCSRDYRVGTDPPQFSSAFLDAHIPVFAGL